MSGTIGLAFSSTPSVFELLRTVRSRRVGLGYRVDSGTTETHPVTGRELTQPKGPRAFISSREPLPLTEAEEALLAWAALGPNGLVAWEASVGAGFDQLVSTAGRTAPEANNTGATDLVIVNDRGTFLYRPASELSDPVAVKPGEEAEKLTGFYREGLIRILPGRPDIDWGLRRAEAPNVPLHGTHQYNINRSGSTWLLPLTDAARLMNGLIDFFGRRHLYLVDDFNGGRIAGLEEFVRPGMLESPVSISEQEQGVLLTSAYPAGCIVQNTRLAAEALGLGAWCLSGYDQHLLFGAEPALMAGLGFQVQGPNRRAPIRTGLFKTIGLPGVKESTCVPSPRYPTAQALVEAWRADQYGAGGWANPSSSALLTGASPWTAEASAVLATDPAVHPVDWAWDAAVAYINYAVETFGSWPVTYDPMLAGFSTIVHHVDPDFYDIHHRPGFITDRIRQHFALWHAASRGQAVSRPVAAEPETLGG